MKPLCCGHWLSVVGGIFVGFLSVADAADWPDWRGANRDGWTTEALPSKLPSTPTVVWRRALGRGYSSPVVGGQQVFVADDSAGKETVHAWRAGTGEKMWSTPVATTWSDEFEPGPRCTPVVHGGRVYFHSNQGEFVALDAQDGRRIWGFNFADYGMEWVPNRSNGPGAATRRGNTGSPLIHGDQVVVAVGSSKNAALCAFSSADGKLRWRSQNDLASYSSPVYGRIGGIEQVVSASCEGLLGVAWKDGRLLWRLPFKTGANRNVLTPIIDGDTVTFSSHTTGLRRLKIVSEGDGQKVVEEWFNPQTKINLSTPVLAGRHYYGLGPAKNFVCTDQSSGRQVWVEGGFDAVASTLTDGKQLLVLMDTGEVRLLAVDPEKYRELSRFQACGKTYSHPAWSEGRLYVRDPRELVVYSF